MIVHICTKGTLGENRYITMSLYRTTIAGDDLATDFHTLCDDNYTMCTTTNDERDATTLIHASVLICDDDREKKSSSCCVHCALLYSIYVSHLFSPPPFSSTNLLYMIFPLLLPYMLLCFVESY